MEQRLPRNVLTPEEVKRILDAPDAKTKKGIRDKAILETFYSTGIRLEEMSRLTVHDVDLTGYVRVNRGKGAKDRVVPLGVKAAECVREYLERVRIEWARDNAEERALWLAWSLAASSHPKTNHLGDAAPVCEGRGHHQTGQSACLAAHVRDAPGQQRGQHCLRATAFGPSHLAHDADLHARQRARNQSHPRRDPPTEGRAISQRNRNGPRAAAIVADENARALPLQAAVKATQIEILIERYRQELEILNFSPRTIVGRVLHLRRFAKFLGEQNITEVATITSGTLADHQRDLFYLPTSRGTARSVSYQNQAMHALRSFFRFLKIEGYVAQDVAGSLPLARTPHTLPRTILTPEEARKVIETPDTGCLLGYRDRTILETLYATGIRKSELMNLTVNDVNLEETVLRINGGKFNKDRVVPLTRLACSFLETYLEGHPARVAARLRLPTACSSRSGQRR